MSTPASNSLSLEQPITTPTASDLLHYDLPDKPLVIVQPSRSWSTFDFKELWAHRELLYFLTWRDLKVRYKQTIFGVAWVIMQPALMTVIFTVFLGMLVRVPSNGVPYPLLVYSGLLPWTFFSSGIVGSSQSLVSSASLITKVYFPRVLIPAANVAGRFVDFVMAFSVFIVLLLYYWLVRHYPITITWKVLALPLIGILLTLFTLGLSILVSCLNVKYRDVGVAIPLLVQLLMFTSPVVYGMELVPQKWQTLYSLNPMVGLIQGFRAALLGMPLPGFALAVTATFTIIQLIGASFVFRRTEKTFADVV